MIPDDVRRYVKELMGSINGMNARNRGNLMKRKVWVVGAIAICAVVVLAVILSEGLLRNGATTAKLQGTDSANKPVAGFAATPTTGIAPLKVMFTDTSTGSATAWAWDFGDGKTATGRDPTHTYSVSGRFTVTLQVSGAHSTTKLVKSGFITVTAPPAQSSWTTILDDEFNTPGVPSHWKPYNGPYSGANHNCAAPSQVQAPGDGYLHLKFEYLPTGTCGAGWYSGGMQVAAAYGGVNQAITVRWRIVPSDDPDQVHSTRIIPMRWVDDPQYTWQQGEADYCEGNKLTGCNMYLHYNASSQIINRYSVDLMQWHTFRVEESNHVVRMYIDDMVNPFYVYTGTETTIPAAFKRAVLQQECDLVNGCPAASYAGDVEDIQIDWIIIQNGANGNTSFQPHGDGGANQQALAALQTSVAAKPAALPPYDVRHARTRAN